MKRAHAALATLCAGVLSPFAISAPAPLIIEESARIELPDPIYDHIGDVGIFNDRAVLTAWRDSSMGVGTAAYLFQRQSDGRWLYTQKLFERDGDDGGLGFAPVISVGMDENTIAFAHLFMGRVSILEKRNGTWELTKTFTPLVFDSGADIALQGNSIALAGDPELNATFGAFTFQRLPDGTWVRGEDVSAFPPHGGGPDFPGGAVAFAGNALVVGSPTGDGLPASEGPGEAQVFSGSPSHWTLASALTAPKGEQLFGSSVAGSARAVFVGNGASVYVYRTDPTLTLDLDHQIEPISLFTRAGTSAIEASGRLLAVALPGDSIRAERSGSIHIYRLPDQGPSRLVARLITSEATPHVSFIDTAIAPNSRGGYQVIGAPGVDFQDHQPSRTAYIFDLKNLDNEANTVTPDAVSDDFETGNAARWSVLPGSRFTINTNNGSHVYRQSDSVGTAGSVITNMDWKDQAIQADITPRAFDGPDRWVGVVIDYTDENNFYYAAIRSTNVAQLKMKRNGVFTTLASINFPVVIGRTYKVRVEKLGTWVRAFVNGAPIGALRDTTLSHGKAGLMMNKTKADFDNVLVTPSLNITMLSENFENEFADRSFTASGLTSWSVVTDGTKVFKQASTAGNARAVTGVSASTDQSVQSRVKVSSFNGSDTWVGLIVHYQDDRNYTYLTLRSNQSIGLRKLVNGQIFHIDDAPLKVNTGAWYTLRLEALGDRVRGYVNGSLMVEGPAPSPQSGRYGLAMYKTAAEFDDFLAVQP